jgi:hypothetical protein
MEAKTYILICYTFFVGFFIFSFVFASLEGYLEKHDTWITLKIIGYNALIFLIVPALCYCFYRCI